MTRKTRTRGLALLIAVLIAADWGSKLWIVNRLAVGESWPIVEGWLSFVHRQNRGVAFSFLSDLPEGWSVPILAGLGLVGVVIFARILRTSPDGVARFAAALVLAGAVGNLGDRVVSGAVTDFVLLAFFPFVFNLADAAITLGGSLLAIRLAREPDAAAAASGSG